MALNIDPQGWLVTLPLLAGLLWLYFQPHDHPLKQVWRELMRYEAQTLAQVTGVEASADSPVRQRVERLLFWSAVTGLTAGTAASVAVYLGLLS